MVEILKLMHGQDFEIGVQQDLYGEKISYVGKSWLSCRHGRDYEEKFDQDLFLNLRYELNPRVRCAFVNV